MARDIISIVLLSPKTLSQTQEQGDSVEVIIMIPQIHRLLDYIQIVPNCSKIYRQSDYIQVIPNCSKIYGRSKYIQVISKCSKYVHFNLNYPKYIYAEAELLRILLMLS